MVFSGRYIGIADPHKGLQVVQEKNKDVAGKRVKLLEFMKHESHVQCLSGVFGMSAEVHDYPATLFRFPLRECGSKSKISQNCYTPKKVRENLFASLKEEAPVLLLFLKSVTKVSMWEWTETSPSVVLTFSMEIGGDIAQNRKECTKLAQGYDRTCSSMSVVVSSITTTTHSSEEEATQYGWLLMNAIGSDVKELREHAHKASVIPWVGIAAPTPTSVKVEPFQFDFDESTNLCNALAIVQWKVEASVCEVDSYDDKASTAGQAFCFLPLPGSISLPVNLHGYFAVADNRRSIKWPSHDEKGEEAKWNELLLLKLVSPLYSLMLGCRSALVRYRGPASDAYAAWPVHGEVKNQLIWSHILDPVLDQLLDLPVLWAETSQGWCWVTAEQAHFVDLESECPPQIALRKLVELGVSVVQLPQKILNTLLSNPNIKEIISKKYITPALVRDTIRGVNTILSPDRREDVYSLLKYILSDKPSLENLMDLEIIPLNTKSTYAIVNGKEIFLFPQKYAHALNLLPGISSLVIDANVPLDLQANLEDLAKDSQSSLTLVTPDVICDMLIALSMKSWYPDFEYGKKCVVKFGQPNHPPMEWVDNIWLWIQSHQAVDKVSHIPLVPTEVICDSTRQAVLLPLDTKPGLCTLAAGGSPAHELLSVVHKLSLIHIPRSKCVFNCSGVEQYIKEVDAHLLLKHIMENLQSLSFSDEEKDCLVEFLAHDLFSSDLTPEEVNILKKLPIFKAGVGGSCMHCIILSEPGLMLPPKGAIFDTNIEYPPNILSDHDSQVTNLLEKKLCIRRSQKIDDFCESIILPHIPQRVPLSSNQQKLIMWMLEYPLSQPKILRNFCIIEPCCGDSPRKPTELYDPEEEVFCRLYDKQNDAVFPHSKYDSVLHVLRQAGLITWSQLTRDHHKMKNFVSERAKSISFLSKSSKSAALQRSKFILKLLIQYNLLPDLSSIPFLFPQSTPPDDYPMSLQWHGEWCEEPLCPQELCCSMSDASIAGSVLPVLSTEYQLHGSQDGFHCPSSREIVQHLKNIVQYTSKCNFETEKVHNVVFKVYDSLNEKAYVSGFPEAWIWWRSEKKFLTPDQCVLNLPSDIGSLEPHLFDISSNQELQMRVSSLLPKLTVDLQQTLSIESAREILEKISVPQGTTLSVAQVQMAIRILNWLKYQGTHTCGDVLIPTSHNTLVCAADCTYDDRSWNKKVQKSKYTFVHEDVAPALAKHFKVLPLSRRVAPSQNLKIKYTKTGQKEPVTRRIKRIVEDYSTTSDIFKELLQNADDAQATQVKFLIDWRQHPTASLFTEELACWQGPALIAYNNAVFSDKDLEHICELAGETKMKDPLKTGRFGVGFCVTYRLTDVPSFLSRKYFTMFDPHTTYLGDRVSAAEAGIRIDLVENREDMTLYEDQFLPYNGLFGCDVFNLDGDGFQGTLFRFPFRIFKTACKSYICQDVIDERRADELIQEFTKQSAQLLLFLKHIKEVSLYIFNNEENYMNELITLKRRCACDPQCNRLNLINLDECSRERSTCQVTTECIFHKSGRIETSNWMVCSAVCRDLNHEEERGLVPFAEVAIKVTDAMCPLSVDGYTFCFLPLPMKTGLPFHINGLFEIGHDRSGLKLTDDGRFGKEWNKSLLEKPLVHAYITALSKIAVMLPLSCTMSENEKKDYLKSYYNLFMLFSKADFDCIRSSVQNVLPKCEELLLWSENKCGQWLRPRDAVILDFSEYAQEMTQFAITVLLKLNWSVCDLPKHVISLKPTERILTCEEFYAKVFLPNVSSIPDDLRDKHITFLLKNMQLQEWIPPLLKNHKFVPVKGCSNLVHPKELIDEKKTLLSSLYDQDEGRFPAEYLQAQDLMHCFKQLGMPTNLSVDEIKKRAETVAKIHTSDPEKAKMRCWKIIEYIQSRHGVQDKKSLTTALCEVPFLPVAVKPTEYQIPWCETEELVEPCRIYNSKWNSVVFSVNPVVDPPDDCKHSFFSLIGASSTPPLELVMSHFLKLIEASQSFNEEALPFVSEIVSEIYKFMNSKRLESDDKVYMKEKTKQREFIWQENKFLKADQVVVKWNKSLYPYLCELSSENYKFQELFMELGIKQEPSVADLVATSSMIAKTKGEQCKCIDDHVLGDEEPVSEEVIDFIEEVVKRLSRLVEIEDQKEILDELYLPDEDCVMRPVKCLACDKVTTEKEHWVQSMELFSSQFDDGKFHFLHPSIPRERAISLGVNPLLDALLQGIEDEDFMLGLDYGPHEDLCDRLKSILSKYPADCSILNEFVQNADDAQATEIVFVLDHRKFSQDKLFPSRHKSWKELQETPALLVVNNSKFTVSDVQGIAKLGRGGKQDACDTIGRFGIGFNVAYHVTDCPSFLTFSESGEPENFCVFDPTCSFANTTKQNPGRRWKVNSKIVLDLPAQFQPFLMKDIAIPLLESLEKEHVVFRLPLTRKRRSSSYPAFMGLERHTLPSTGSVQLSRKVFDTHNVAKLFKDMEDYAQRTLLFLNHVCKVSAVEIKDDGQVVKHFSTSLSMTDGENLTCTKFSCDVKGIRKQGHEAKEVSVAYKVTVSHNSPPNNTEDCQDWLVCKRYSPVSLWREESALAEDETLENMRPIGGIAAPLRRRGLEGNLFCFLPTPLKSMVPVHVNGHFLVDDSRKHLEKMQKGSTNWNGQLTANVIAPCYVDMLMNALQMTQNGESDVEWFYGLFPMSNQEGEVASLNILELVYRLLYEKNPEILLQTHPDTKDKKWFSVNGNKKGYFFLPFPSKFTNKMVQKVPQLHHALVKLKVPVLTDEVPSALFKNFKVNEQYTGLLNAEIIIKYMKKVRVNQILVKSVLTTEVIKLLLQFILESKGEHFIKSAVEQVPLLLSYDNQLWQGKSIFKSKHVLLLPHCTSHFIHPDLEEGEVGRILASTNCDIVVDLPVEFVRDNVNIKNSTVPVKITDLSREAVGLVVKLWMYLITKYTYNMGDFLLKYFPHKPLIPADDEKLYPVKLSATLLPSSHSTIGIWSALKKLGYPTVSFQALKMAEPPYYICSGLSNSCFNGDDIIHCFLLKSPPKDAELSSTDVRCIIESVTDHRQLMRISNTLMNLKIFKTVSEGFMSMKGNPCVAVMPHGVPSDGMEHIQQSCREEYIILDEVDEITMQFYETLLRGIDKNETSFYRRVFLPHMHVLSVAHIQIHLRYIFCKKKLMNQLREDLKGIKFIQLPNGSSCKVEEMYDPDNSFFIEFYSDKLLPEPWSREKEDWLPLFKELGFRHEVSDEDLLRQCRSFSHNHSELEPAKMAARSELLLSTFLDMTEKLPYVPSCAYDLSTIPFIYNNGQPEVFCEVNSLFGVQMPISEEPLCFKGSVLSCDENLAAFCRRILPLSCDVLKYNKYPFNCLGIESPVQPKTIVCNLKELSCHYTCTQSQAGASSSSLKLIFESHFKALNCSNIESVSELKETLCVPVHTYQTFLTLVKPSQLVHTIPSDIDLTPFFYTVPPAIAQYQNLLRAFDVPQEITAENCIFILQTIYQQLKETGQNLSSHNKFKEIALFSYKQLVCILRKGEGINIQGGIILPTEDDELLPLERLLFNDAPWFSERLHSSSESFKFLKLPPPNDNGEKAPPVSLGVAKLTSVICEELHESMHSDDWACNKELLYARDNTRQRCQAVQKVIETLRSQELKDGLLRVYYSERQERPSQEYKETIGRLCTVQVTCVTSKAVQTVLKKNGEVIAGSESMEKYCFVSTKGHLVIAPHNLSSDTDFIQSLAKALNILICNEIKNEVFLMAMVNCEPQDIEKELDRLQVPRYDPTKIKETQYTEAGERVSLDRFMLKDCLLILNYNIGEIVYYYDNAKSCMFTARVKEITDPDDYQKCVVTISTKAGSCSSKDHNIKVSPGYIFKILTPAQEISLFSDPSTTASTLSKTTLSTAEPVHLLAGICQQEDLYLVMESPFFREVPKEIALMRLMTHIHYLNNKLSPHLKVKVNDFLRMLEKGCYFEKSIISIARNKQFIDLIKRHQLTGGEKYSRLFSSGAAMAIPTSDPSQPYFYHQPTPHCQSFIHPTPKYQPSSGQSYQSGSHLQSQQGIGQQQSCSSSVALVATTYPSQPYYQSGSHLQSQQGIGQQQSCSSSVALVATTYPSQPYYQSGSHLQSQQRIGQQQSCSSSVALVATTYPSQPYYHQQTPHYQSFSLPHHLQATPQYQSSSGQSGSRFQPQPQQRRGQSSYRRPQRFHFQSYQPTAQPPPLPETDERLAKIWVDQGKVDYKAALFLMGAAPLSLTPVIVAPPQECIAEAAEDEGAIAATFETEISQESSQLVYSLGSCVEESISSLNLECDEEEDLGEEEAISSLNNSQHDEEEDALQLNPQFAAVVCFLCHEAVEKCLKGAMYAYCGINTGLINCSNIVTIYKAIKDSVHFPKSLLQPVEHCVMQINEHEHRSRYPNSHFPPCPPAVIYTTANAREALKATKRLLEALIKDEKLAPIVCDIDELHIPQFTTMLRSSGGKDGKPFLCFAILISWSV